MSLNDDAAVARTHLWDRNLRLGVATDLGNVFPALANLVVNVINLSVADVQGRTSRSVFPRKVFQANLILSSRESLLNVKDLYG